MKGVYTSGAGGPEETGHIFGGNTKLPETAPPETFSSKYPKSRISEPEPKLEPEPEPKLEPEPEPKLEPDLSDNLDCRICLENKINEIMTRNMVTVREDTLLEEIFGLFEKYRFHTFPVLDSAGNLMGVIDQDIILEILLFTQVPRAKHTHITAVRSLGIEAGDIMITHPVTVSHDSTIRHTADLMMKHRFDRACVVEAGKLVGVISKRDLLNEIGRKRKETRKTECRK